MIYPGNEVVTGYKGLCISCHKYLKIQTAKGECRWCYEKSKPNYKDRYQDKNLKLRYGISLADKQTMKRNQYGKCLICTRTEDEIGTQLVVDHCYKTGKVRGLLCYACNSAIGKLQDSIEIIERALNYLKSNV